MTEHIDNPLSSDDLLDESFTNETIDENGDFQEGLEEDIDIDLENALNDSSSDFSSDTSFNSSFNEGHEITDEELDSIADTVIDVLQSILSYFDIGEVIIDEYEGDEGELILDIAGENLAVLIGRHGKTLDALQFLISAITVRKIGFRYPVVIDVEGYKGRQRQKLESIARSAANRASSQNRSIKLRPMTPYERRIVHIALRDDDRVETASEGEGIARHVVVIPQ